MKLATTMIALVAVMSLGFVGCSSYKESGGQGPGMVDRSVQTNSDLTVARFRQADPTMDRFFKGSAGYAVFPNVAKGAAGIGGAHGEGVLYEKGLIVGYTELSQATIGLQLGGQAYSEIIFFEDELALNEFKQGNVEFSAQASAVAATAGASADADYERGVAVFTMAKGGLMFEASIGGQNFDYYPKP